MRVLLLAALATVATPAEAADWRYLTANAVGGQVYYDATSIQRTGNKARLWIRVDHSRDRSTRAREVRELWSYDCGAQTTLALSSISYLPNGAILAQRVLADDPFDYTPVIPESIAETAMRLVCR
ncbi:MAG: hypothetical protein QOG13_3175 [Sphingomonadales bacterium]|jgi:hypothetical protein|nr:hypothetical protein [Sphingomonadales bacterium]